MTNDELQTSNYRAFRGRCKELSEAAQQQDPTLRLVRGHYFCPVWNTEEAHWWCEREDGTVVDPSAAQFPSQGMGTYTEFSGYVSCEECGKDLPEDQAIAAGRFPVCSSRCYGALVGVSVG